MSVAEWAVLRNMLCLGWKYGAGAKGGGAEGVGFGLVGVGFEEDEGIRTGPVWRMGVLCLVARACMPSRKAVAHGGHGGDAVAGFQGGDGGDGGRQVGRRRSRTSRWEKVLVTGVAEAVVAA
jgi:hypothetical protein